MYRQWCRETSLFTFHTEETFFLLSCLSHNPLVFHNRTSSTQISGSLCLLGPTGRLRKILFKISDKYESPTPRTVLLIRGTSGVKSPPRSADTHLWCCYLKVAWVHPESRQTPWLFVQTEKSRTSPACYSFDSETPEQTSWMDPLTMGDFHGEVRLQWGLVRPFS